MHFSQDIEPGAYSIKAYASGQITIIRPADDAPVSVTEVLTTSFIMTPSKLIRDWPPRGFAELNAEHIRCIAELGPEVVLLGTGPQLQFPSYDITQSLWEQGIGVEVMDNAAACRTYNVLMHEGRDVALGLLC